MDETIRRPARVNVRAMAVTLGVVLVIVIVFLCLSATESQRLRSEALRQAERLVAEGRGDLAIRHLDRYLALAPNDIEPIEIKAKLLAESASDADSLIQAAQVNDLLVRLDPDGPGRQATRQRLTELYLRHSDAYRAGPVFRNAPEHAAHELRYRAAETIARQMIDREARSAIGWRLLGMALEGLAVPGDPAALSGSIEAYEEAIRLDPNDVTAASRLASLYRDRMTDPDRAERVLDALLRSGPDRVEVRLARHDYYTKAKNPSRATAELQAALQAGPSLISVRLTAAADALRQGRTKDARRQIEAAAPADRESPRAQLLLGMIDFHEQRYDDAIEHWRAGLAKAGGTDSELTWWLAYAQLQCNRPAAARPLAAQYARIVNDESDPLGLLLQALLDEKLGKSRRALASLDRIRDKVGASWLTAYYMALGRCHESTWNESQAIAAYRKAAQSDPSSPLPRLAIASLLAERRLDVAIAELRSAIETIPDDASLRTTLAGLLFREQMELPAPKRSWLAFDRTWSEAASAAPGHPAVLLLRARRQALETTNPEQSADLIRQAVRSAPHDPAVWVAHAAILERQGKPDQALRALDDASASEAVGDSAVIRIARARLLAAIGRGREGRASLVRDLDRLPPAERAILREALGRLLAAQGDIPGAREAFAEWARLVPESPGPAIALLELAISNGDDTLIKASLESLRDLEGTGDVMAKIARVVDLLRVSPRSDKAREALAEATTTLENLNVIVPDLRALAFLRGQVAERSGRLDKAISEYRLAWRGGVEAAFPRLVDLLVRTRRVAEIATLRQASPDGRIDAILSRSGSGIRDLAGIDSLFATSDLAGIASPQARIARARLLATAGKIDEADAILLELAEESPRNEALWLDLLRFRAENGRLRDLDAMISRIKTRVSPKSPEVLQARCRWVVGDRSGSEAAFSRAIKDHPDDPDAQLAIATYFQDTSRPAAAVARLRRVLQIDPQRRLASRQLALSLSEIATDMASWERAWQSFGPETNEPDDRFARALVLSRCPVPTRSRSSIARLDDLLSDLVADHPVAMTAREALIRLLLRTGDIRRASEIAAVSASTRFDPRLVGLLVEAMLQNHDYGQAERQLDLWNSLTPGNRREALLRARLVADCAGPDGAAVALEKAFLDRGEGQSATVLGREVFARLVKLGPAAMPIADAISRRLTTLEPGAGWTRARVALLSDRRDEALTFCQTAINAGSKADIDDASRVVAEVAIDPASKPTMVDRALGLLEAAAKRDPESIELLRLRAVVRHRQGNYNEEVALYRAILARQPAHAVALNNLAWVLSEDLHQPSEALTYIDKIINDVGTFPMAPSTRSAILVRLGRVPEAIEGLEAVAKRTPTALNSYYLALAYKKANRDSDFRRTLVAARQAGLTAETLDPPQRDEYQAIAATAP